MTLPSDLKSVLFRIGSSLGLTSDEATSSAEVEARVDLWFRSMVVIARAVGEKDALNPVAVADAVTRAASDGILRFQWSSAEVKPLSDGFTKPAVTGTVPAPKEDDRWQRAYDAAITGLSANPNYFIGNSLSHEKLVSDAQLLADHAVGKVFEHHWLRVVVKSLDRLGRNSTAVRFLVPDGDFESFEADVRVDNERAKKLTLGQELQIVVSVPR